MEIVDVKNYQRRTTIAAQVSDRDRSALVSPGNPVRDREPVGPAARDIALRIQFTSGCSKGIYSFALLRELGELA